LNLSEQVGVLILTHDEGPNIERTLSKLEWAKRILIIDSGSTDETLDVGRGHPQVEVIHRAFDNFANQCNFGLSRIGTHWVLSLDADYELSDALIDELRALTPDPDVGGYQARFVYRIYGRSLRGTLYSPRIVLYRKEKAAYQNEGHAHRVIVEGRVLPLTGPIYHDDRKSLARWFISQQRYAQLEAKHLLSAERAELSRIDRMRLLAGPAPFAAFFYTLIIKRCLLDGWAGWFYALQRMLAENMLALEIAEQKLQRLQSNEP
jgi:glycosyltransferase involved in cell wall biosynthesis